MPDQDFGLLSDTGRELYVADAINDLTRLRLQLASASLAGISERPEWGGIAASLRALGEDHPAIVVDAFAEVLKAVGEDAHAGEDHEFVALGVDTVDMLLRAGDEFDPSRLKSFVDRIRAFSADRGLESPNIPEAISAGQLVKPASRSPFATSLRGFELPPIDPPSWDLDEFAAPVEETDPLAQTDEVDQPTVDVEAEETPVALEAVSPEPAVVSALEAGPGQGGVDSEVEATEPLTDSVGDMVGATDEAISGSVPTSAHREGAESSNDHSATSVEPASVSVSVPASAPGHDAKKVVNFGPLFDPKLPLNISPSHEQTAPDTLEPEPVQASSPSTPEPKQPPPSVAPLGVRSQPDPVAELASAFDSIPAATAARAGSANLAALAQGALWLAECVRPILGVGGAAAASAVDGVRRDALAALAVDHVVSAAGSRQRIQVGEQTRIFLRRLQNEVGSFDDFAIDAQWCRIHLSEAAADLATRLGLIGAAPLAVSVDGGRQIWVPVQAQRLTIWQSVAEDGTACALPDLASSTPVDGPWQALMIGAGGRPEVVAVAAGVPMPPAAPVVLLGSGPVVLDPGRWKRLRSTCFVLGAPLAGLDWVAGAALVAGESAVLLNPGMI